MASRSLIPPCPTHSPASPKRSCCQTRAKPSSYFVAYSLKQSHALSHPLLTFVFSLFSLLQVYAYPTAGGATTDITVKDLENGTYVGTFVPERKGPHYVVVTFKERHVDGSPYTMSISPGPVSAPHSVAEGLGLTSAIAGSTASFKIQPRDQFGEPSIE